LGIKNILKNQYVYYLLIVLVFIIFMVYTIFMVYRPCDFETRQSPEKLESILSSVVTLSTLAEYKTEGMKKDELPLEKEIYGSGIHIGDGYILTLTHCSHIENKIDIPTPLGFLLTIDIDILSESTKIKGGEELELIGRNGEISLFKTSNNIPLTYLTIGNIEDIKMGKEVVIICNAFAAGLGFRIGHIYSTNVGEELFSGENQNDVFSIDCYIIRGTSGGPVLLYTPEGIKLIGVAAANLIGGGMSFAFNPRYIKDSIKIIKEGKD